MDTATPRTQSAFLSSLSSRRKGPIAPLRIDTPPHATNVALVSEPDTTSASALSSATSDPDPFLWPPPPSRSHSRNMKRLSLSIPSAQSSTASLFSPLSTEPSKRIAPAPPPDGPPATRRRPSVVSLPSATSSSFWHRKDEDADGDEPGSVPYLGGPIQILPGIWLGNEDNARDWRTLLANGIKSVLNVAKEVTCPIEGVPSQTLRSVTSHSDLALAGAALSHSGPVYYPAHLPSGRPGMHYLQLPWSHGQSDLVTEGFPSAMAFVDHALERGDGILIQYVRKSRVVEMSGSLMVLQLPVRSFTIRHAHDRPGDARRRPVLSLRASGGVGPQVDARCLRFREAEEQVGRTEHVVSTNHSIPGWGRG